MKIPQTVTAKVVREVADQHDYGQKTSDLLVLIALLLIEIRDKD